MKFILTIFSLLLLTMSGFTQSVTIEGSITSSGESIIGASIINKNTAQGTTSDSEGNFRITASSGDFIEVSYLGYKTYQFEVGERKTYVIELSASTLAFDEVVVTALGLKRESKALGYSIQKLESRSVSEVKAVNFVDNLTGKVAGVTISQGPTGVGSTSKIVIRGESSFTQNNPLFVVDGIPINNNTTLNVTNELAAGFQEVDFGNGAMDISPDDIASVSVLKGPGAAALYGTRASNGVIVIETKDGSKAKGLGVSFNSSYFVERPFKLPEFQNKYGQGNSGQFAFVNGLGGGVNDNITYSYGPALDAGLLIPQYDSPVTLPDGRVVRGGDVAVHGGLPITPTPFVSHPDNLKNFYETGQTRINNIAFAGKYDKGHYRLSLSNTDSDSYIPGVNYKRNNIAARMNFQPTEALTINTSINYSQAKSDNRPANGYGSENINYSLVAWLGRQTDLEPLKAYWQPGLEGIQQYSFNYTFFDNPYLILLENQNGFNRDRVFGNVSATYDITPKLSATLRTGLDNADERRTFKRAFSSNRFANGAYAEHDISFREVNTDFLLNYSERLNHIGFDIAIGGNRMDQYATSKQTQAIGLAQPGVYKLSNAATPLSLFQYDADKRINSFYGLAKLSYKDFFFLDVTGRNDWSSALATPEGSENASFFYPSVSASILLSKVFVLPEFISFAKIRGSWAQVGNDTDPYQTAGVFAPQVPVSGLPTFSDQNFIANNNLLPEQTTAIEFGADFRFVEDRFSLDFSYYNNLTENQILSLPISNSTGYAQRVINGGAVRSKGIEVLAGINSVRHRSFRWSTFFNFSTNRSTVESLPEDASSLTIAYSRVYDNPNQTVYLIVEEGGLIGDLWGTGYAKNENGDFLINDEGRLIVDNTLKKLGNYNPDFILGVANELGYKNWSFSFLLDWRQGGEIVSRTQALAGVGGQLKETEYRPEEGLIFEGVRNIGTVDNPNYIPNDIPVSAEAYYRQYYDRNHEENNTYDASYLKIREMRLSYAFSKNRLNKSFLRNLGELELAVIGRNLYAWSKIPHFDPEQFAIQGKQLVSGVEDMSYPSARSIGVSLRLTL